MEKSTRVFRSSLYEMVIPKSEKIVSFANIQPMEWFLASFDKKAFLLWTLILLSLWWDEKPIGVSTFADRHSFSSFVSIVSIVFRISDTSWKEKKKKTKKTKKKNKKKFFVGERGGDQLLFFFCFTFSSCSKKKNVCIHSFFFSREWKMKNKKKNPPPPFRFCWSITCKKKKKYANSKRCQHVLTEKRKRKIVFTFSSQSGWGSIDSIDIWIFGIWYLTRGKKKSCDKKIFFFNFCFCLLSFVFFVFVFVFLFFFSSFCFFFFILKKNKSWETSNLREPIPLIQNYIGQSISSLLVVLGWFVSIIGIVEQSPCHLTLGPLLMYWGVNTWLMIQNYVDFVHRLDSPTRNALVKLAQESWKTNAHFSRARRDVVKFICRRTFAFEFIPQFLTELCFDWQWAQHYSLRLLPGGQAPLWPPLSSILCVFFFPVKFGSGGGGIKSESGSGEFGEKIK